MADDGSGAGLGFFLFLGLLVLVGYGIARARGPKAPARRHDPPRRDPARANTSYVPMQTADARWVPGGMGADAWRAGRTFRTDAGDLVRSPPEVRVANELRRRGLRYEYEPLICGYRPDFFLPDHGIVIEYWGLDEPSYNQRRRRKTARYLSAGYKLVSLEPGKGISVERDLERQLYHKMRA
jgi:very-short-patch-repair endonuclease